MKGLGEGKVHQHIVLVGLSFHRFNSCIGERRESVLLKMRVHYYDVGYGKGVGMMMGG